MTDQQSPPDGRAFRQTMGLFATGVTVLAVTTPAGEPVGMTANAVASLSLDPMLLLVCVEKKARMASHILAAPGFSICILGEHQAALSDYFAGRWPGDQPPPFTFEQWVGGPLLQECIAALGCTKHLVLEEGDHWIVIGQVVALHHPENPSDPLIFYASHYRHLAPIGG